MARRVRPAHLATTGTATMTTAYLTDAAVWITICAARLLELGTRAASGDAESTAADLYEEAEYRALDPCSAAEAFRVRHLQVKAG